VLRTGIIITYLISRLLVRRFLNIYPTQEYGALCAGLPEERYHFCNRGTAYFWRWIRLAPVAIRERPALPCDCDATFQPFASGLLSATSPANDDSTLQPKAVLMVVLAADREATAVAKPGVEIFGLYEA
jgi:hypothetical protein